MASLSRKPPRLDIQGNRIVAQGCWRADMLAAKGVAYTITESVESIHETDAVEWDLTQIDGLDYTGAQLLWDLSGRSSGWTNCWGS